MEKQTEKKHERVSQPAVYTCMPEKERKSEQKKERLCVLKPQWGCFPEFSTVKSEKKRRKKGVREKERKAARFQTKGRAVRSDCVIIIIIITPHSSCTHNQFQQQKLAFCALDLATFCHSVSHLKMAQDSIYF